MCHLMLLCISGLALLISQVSAVTDAMDEGESATLAALAVDGQCNDLTLNSTHCALNALQVRRHMLGGYANASSETRILIPFGHPSAFAEYPSYPGYTLMLVEEFDEPLDLDSDAIWTWSDGGLIEGQARFTKENIKFEDGKMILEMSDNPPAHAQPCSHAEVRKLPYKSRSSGEIRTRHNMFRYGRYEARMKAPMVQPGTPETDGNFVATMFVFRDGKFKHWREIDIEVTGDSSGALQSNVIYAEDAYEFNIKMEDSERHEMDFNVRSDFHTYAFEWLPDRIAWYADGRLLREKRGGHNIPKLSAKIMMNLWMFDERALFGGKQIQNNRFPMRSEYDWFRFYKWDGDVDYPCADMGDQCLTKDDMYVSSNNPCDGIPQVGTVLGQEPCKAVCA